jgi:hypothetical protein
VPAPGIWNVAVAAIDADQPRAEGFRGPVGLDRLIGVVAGGVLGFSWRADRR